MTDRKIPLEDALATYKSLNTSAEDKITTFRSARNMNIKDYPSIVDTEKLSDLLKNLMKDVEDIISSSGFDIVSKNKKLSVVPKEHGAEDILALSKSLCRLYISIFDIVLESGMPFPEIISLYFKYKTIEIYRSDDCDLSLDLDEKIIDLLDLK